MRTTSNAIQLLLSNLARPAGRGEELHRVNWFIDNGIHADFECLHPPVPAPGICDSVNFEAGDADELIELYEGDETPLRDGIIKSWWAKSGSDDADLYWAYEDEPAVQAAVPEEPRTTVEAAPASRGLFGTSNRTLPPQRHDVRWHIGEGVAEARVTCLHEPVEHCDKTEFTEDALLPYTHKNGRTGLRDGIIESWWTERDCDGYELFWDYTANPSQEASTDAAGTAVSVEGYVSSPEVSCKLDFQVEKIRATGLSGTLKDVRWDHTRQAMAATLFCMGLDLEIVSSEHEFTVDTVHTTQLDPNHAGETRQESPTCVRRITPSMVASAITNSVRYSHLGYAWASGKVRSNEDVRFDLPLSFDSGDGRWRTEAGLETADTALELVLMDGVLEVSAYSGVGNAESLLDAALQKVGSTRGDLVASMQACCEVDSEWK